MVEDRGVLMDLLSRRSR